MNQINTDWLPEKSRKFLDERNEKQKSKKRIALEAMQKDFPELLEELEAINKHPENETKPKILNLTIAGELIYEERE